MTDKAGSEIAKTAREVLVEGAKAQAETAKAVTATVGAARDAGGFLSRFFGEAPEEFGKMITERVRVWRLENLEKLAARIAEVRKRGQLPENQISPLDFGTAYRITEAASEESDETVQDLWARLIANATTPGSGTTVKKTFIDLLKSVSADEVLFLDFLFKFRIPEKFENKAALDAFNVAANAAAEAGWRKITPEDQRIAIQNLTRLRCITYRPFNKHYSNVFESVEIGNRPYDHVRIITVNPDEFAKVIADIQNSLFVSAGVKEPPSTADIPLYSKGGFGAAFPFAKITLAEMNFTLTPLGLDLMTACNVPAPPEPSTSA